MQRLCFGSPWDRAIEMAGSELQQGEKRMVWCDDERRVAGDLSELLGFVVLGSGCCDYDEDKKENRRGYDEEDCDDAESG